MKKLNCALFAVSTVQEEIGLRGAQTSAFGIDPHVGIAVDVTHATDQPGVELGETAKHTLGSGPVIARGSYLHPAVFELLHEAAEAEEIPFTIESIGRFSGTDADAINAVRAGIPCGVVSIPLRSLVGLCQQTQRCPAAVSLATM